MEEFLTQFMSADAAKELIPQLTTLGGNIVLVLLILFAALVVGGWVRSLIMRLLERVDFDKTLTKFFGSTARLLVLLFAGLGCLEVFGFNTTSFAAALGGASVAIGLAFQGSLSNVAAGIMLLTFRPFKVGDVVSVAGQTGGVKEIGLFSTSMNTPDNRHIIIPNGQIFGSTLTNITHNPTRRVDVSVGVDYDADINEVRAVLLKAARSVEGALSEPAPTAFLVGLGGSSVDWQVRVFCNTAEYFDVFEATVRATKMHLDEAGIGIPYPHMVVQRYEMHDA
ncbi:MAG: mechanosensitive ion channel family protein [Myxococcota bacterium]